VKPKRAIAPLKPYQPGKGIDQVKREFQLTRIIKLASNENVYGCSPLIYEKLKLEDLHLYPDGYAEKLRRKLAEHLQVNLDQLIFGGGSEEVIQLLCRTYLEKGTNTVMANLTFPQYKHYAMAEGAEIKEIPLRDGKHDLEQMLNVINENTRIVWLCTPNNPTGCYINESELLSFITRVPKEVLVVVDEAYYEYVFAQDYPNTIPLLSTFPNLIILRTFSKAYGLAGLRVGYGIASEEIIQHMNKIRGPFNVTSLGQEAALLALEDQDFIQKVRNENVRVRTLLENYCRSEGFNFYPSETNFLFIHLPVSGLQVAEKLLSYGFIVRAGELLGEKNRIRVTIGKEEDMKTFMDILPKCL
jgi:histidinol-phosphate aminotransferase